MRGLSPNSRGILMMLCATACFTLNDTLLKLAMAEVPPFQALFLRGIGATLIGMHLKRVAVPLRLQQKSIGCASVTAAWTRPKLIGGARAVYK